MSDENWLPIVGYEGYYEVSDRGSVRSVERTVTQQSRWGGWTSRTYPSQLIRPQRRPDGRLVVSLSRDNRKRTRLIHILVLEAFICPRPQGMEGCHNNDVFTDNRIGNLRWDTRSANERDKVRNGKHHHAKKTRCKRGHEFNAANTRIRKSDGGRECRSCERMRGNGRTRTAA